MSTTAKPEIAPRRALVARVLRYALAVVLVALVLLVVAELVARRVCEPPVEPYTPHPLFHITRTPHYKQKKISIEEPPYTFQYEVNAVGFRGKKMQTVKKA